MIFRRGFTLLEVLIAVALLGLVMLALNRSVELLRDSNAQLFRHLEAEANNTKIVNVLYRDIIGSNGDINISKDEFTRLCIKETRHSLYELPVAKVCWVVLKEENTLLRIEGNEYNLPTLEDQKVEADRLIKNIELFDIYQKDDKILVLLKEEAKDPMSFMIQGITPPKQTSKPTNPKNPTPTKSSSPPPSQPPPSAQEAEQALF